MNIGDKVTVSQSIMLHYDKLIGDKAIIIGKSIIDGFWLVRFPKMNVELHDGTVSAMHKVVEGKHSDRDDCLWVNQMYLGKRE